MIFTSAACAVAVAVDAAAVIFALFDEASNTAFASDNFIVFAPVPSDL